MVESTARAERFDLQTSTSPFYTWEVSQKPVSVRMPFSLIDRLEREAVESFRSLSSKGSEIGGLLMGSVSPGNPMVVSIADYELIECDHARGPLYRLSEADMDRFECAIEKRLAAGGAGVAGFFRSHTRKGIALDADDLAFFADRFRDPHHIALLVRPFATKVCTGGIFIWEGGKVHGDASSLEFPFRSSHLGASKAPAAAADGAKVAGSVEAPPSAPKPAGRIQIVPNSSRREVSFPTPPNAETALHLAAPAAAAHAALPEAAPVSVAAPALTPAMPAVEEKPANAEKPARFEKIEKTEKTEKIEQPAKSEHPENAGRTKGAVPVATPEVPATRSSKPLKLILAAAASIALFVVLFVYPGLLYHPSKTAAVAHPDSSLLQLRVERSAGELVLTWNRDSDVIKTASKAVLVISDGARQENVEMDLAQLRNGSIQYSPSSADISFRMEVTGRNQTKTTSESVRVLRTRPSPIQDQTQLPQPGSAGAIPVTAGSTAATPIGTGGMEPAPAVEEAPKPVSAPLKAFQAESLSQRLRPAAASADLPEEPGVSSAVASAQIPGVTLGGVTQGPRAPALPPAPAPSVPSVQSGGIIQQAVLVLRKEPEYPKIAKQTGAKGLVTVAATIGKDGRIKAAKVISGHPMLANAARAAVLQWIYKPTLLNGQPVETETQIQLNFLGEK